MISAGLLAATSDDTSCAGQPVELLQSCIGFGGSSRHPESPTTAIRSSAAPLASGIGSLIPATSMDVAGAVSTCSQTATGKSVPPAAARTGMVEAVPLMVMVGHEVPGETARTETLPPSINCTQAYCAAWVPFDEAEERLMKRVRKRRVRRMRAVGWCRTPHSRRLRRPSTPAMAGGDGEGSGGGFPVRPVPIAASGHGLAFRRTQAPGIGSVSGPACGVAGMTR